MRLFNGKISSNYRDVHLVVLDVIELLKLKCDLTDKNLLFTINFVLREVLNNAVEHGNRFDESKKISITVDYELPKIIFTVQDEGEGFTMDEEHVSQDVNYVLRERNRGMQLIRDMNFEVDVEHTQVRLVLDLKNEAGRKA